MGSNRYRSSDEIIFLILKLCLRPAKKTHIACYANLNSFQLNKYLRLLIDGGFLTTTKDNRLAATHRGMLLVERLEKVFELYENPEEKRSLNDVKIALKSVVNDMGYELHENYAISGTSGVLHAFDYVLKLSPPIAIIICGLSLSDVESVNKVLSFIVQVLDINGYGVCISIGRISEKLKATLDVLLRDEVKRRVKIVNASSSIEAFKEDLYTALCDILAK